MDSGFFAQCCAVGMRRMWMTDIEKDVSVNEAEGFDMSCVRFQLFVELDELYVDEGEAFEWREKSRWIKFEEDVEEGAERWGKPHVASLSFHSLLELRRVIEQGKLVK